MANRLCACGVCVTDLSGVKVEKNSSYNILIKAQKLRGQKSENGKAGVRSTMNAE